MKRIFLIGICLAIASTVLGADGPTVDAQQATVRVLLLSGQNNHNWQETTPKIESLLRSTGRFTVDVTERPDQLTRESLKPYDVILSNWNAYGKRASAITSWPETAREAYLAFVRGGGGHVVVHAGSSSFADWDEYLEVSLAAWKAGQTGHGPRHAFTVRIEPLDHPITRGLVDFTTHDELWNRPGLRKEMTVLASSFSDAEQRGTGQFEPAAMVGQFGRGRCFTLLLGHGAAEMENEGFQSLLLRGTEWAATGNVTDAETADDVTQQK